MRGACECETLRDVLRDTLRDTLRGALGPSCERQRGGCARRGWAQNAQMTVEAAVVLPVLLAVGVIACHALTFLSDCAAFDQAFRTAVCQEVDDGFEGALGAAEVGHRVAEDVGIPEERISVACDTVALGHLQYTGTYRCPAGLFGSDVEVFGMRAPDLSHQVTFTVSPYRKGVVI